MAGGDGADEGDRLELLAAIKAHSQHLTTEGGACGGSSDDVAAGLGGGGGWSGEDWRRAFQQLVGFKHDDFFFSLFFYFFLTRFLTKFHYFACLFTPIPIQSRLRS